MASLWDTVTGANRQNSSAEQLKREEARRAAEEEARRKAEQERKEREKAEAAVRAITFKRGGPVKKAATKVAVKKPAAKTKSRR